ncbi:thioredoxin domain-containing protein [Cryobacterium sp. SO2]|uniref:DsbA family protein n=1 Tax=Cryobacterium sp. SO2 TaxID=1897060 RepID=UPI00223E6152|nr:thioredoxin domain-containing protein [Cryobacterium sp. SO2]WEO77876.1 thioredoxin domain-containing protein [Cryobacterium sp. SO2]
MNAQTPGQPLPPKKDRREVARETARIQREEQKKREARNRWFLRGGIGLTLVAVAAIVAVLIVGSIKPAAPGPLNMASDGILMQGDGTAITAVPTAATAADADPVATDVDALTDTVNITVYLDYLCPYCNQFETANAEQLTNWLTAGNITLEVHPISILDNSSNGTKYSTRAANAASCVANYQPDSFLDVNAALFANQPTEGTSGLTDAELVSLVETAGVTDESVATCITDQEFSKWVGTATDRALAGPLPNTSLAAVTGTPTVLVQGVQYSGDLADAAAFETFVMEQATATSTTDDTSTDTGE